MGDILFLAHRIPFPPDRGDKIRSHHLLSYLARQGKVHVASFAEDAEDLAHVGAVAALAETYCIARRDTSMVKAGAGALLRGKPVSLSAFAAPQLHDYVKKTLQSYDIDTIFVFSGQMAQYLPAKFGGQIIMDFVDMDSAKFASYAETHNPPMKQIYARESGLMARYERKIALRADVSLFVSRAEAALFMAQNGLGAAQVRTLPNGIDTVFYDPHTIAPEPRLVQIAGPKLVFTGQMDYPPNVDAVTHFANYVLPRVRSRFPGTVFAIVGRNPTDDVLALHDRDGVVVTGAVPDVRGWIKAADIVVAPLRIARGVQNKVLEAMAMAKPVVASKEAATGIDADHDRQFLVAVDDAHQVQLISELLADPARAAHLGAEARHLVVADMGWDAALAPLDALLGGRAEQARKVA